MWTAAFWKATAERVVASIAGGALSAIGTDWVDLYEMDARAVTSIALGAGLVSLLKALAGEQFRIGGTAGPSWANESVTRGRHVA